MLRYQAVVTRMLVAASALLIVGGCGDSTTSDDATGGAGTGGSTSEDGGSGTPTGGSASEDGGSGTATGGSTSGDGGAATGGEPVGGAVGGDSGSGGTPAGGSGGTLLGGSGGTPVGGSGGTPAGGSGGTLLGGSGGTLLGGSGGAPVGGSSGAATGGAPVGGSGGTATGGAQVGGAGGRIQCGVEVCHAGEICCGPAECGSCISALSGANCPDVCPGIGGAGGGGGTCAGTVGQQTPPDLDRTCTTASDCFLGVHWADCCGSQLAVSYSNAELAPFTAYEATCAPACACASSAPLAEDGSPLTAITEAVAECIDGRCLARGPEHAGTCLDSGDCINTSDAGSCQAAPGPLGAGICRGGSGICFYCDCAAPDTPIATPDGERPIAELQVGDLVYSVEGPGIVVVPIARVNRRRVESHHVVEVELDSGTRLQISAGHPTADGRTFADLAAGDELDGERIATAQYIAYPYPYTHDILPASSTGAYFAGGVLIGSTLMNRAVSP